MEDITVQLQRRVRVVGIGAVVVMCASLFMGLRLLSYADSLADHVRMLERDHKALQDQLDAEHEDLNYQIIQLQEDSKRLREQLQYRGKSTWL